MAAASSILSEDEFLCSVCLDVLTEPVSTPCGHNFCRACIHKYWDSSDTCQCPFCRTTFPSKPELHVNTFLSQLATEFTERLRATPLTTAPGLLKEADILCDICSEGKDKAVKSCLVCLTSFCKVHLEPHQRVSVLKGHKLIDPVSNLDEKLCKEHCRLTELYCRTDETFVCVVCFKTSHKSHSVVPLEEEYEAVMVKKESVEANFQKMIQSRSDKIYQIQNSVDVSQIEADKEKEASVRVFTDFIRSIQERQTELVKVIEERQKAMEQKADGFLKELKMELEELKSRSSQLEQLSKSEDHHCFLKNFSTLCSPSVKDWTNISVQTDLSFGTVRVAVVQEKEKINEIIEKIPEITMKRMREHAVDVTLDPDTAHRSLVISQDRKQVTTAAPETLQLQNYDSPKRFQRYPEVLAKEGFRGGKFYFEVQVKGKTEWALGVARESVERKGDKRLSVLDGYWTIGLDGGKYLAYENPAFTFKPRDKLQKVGIFVDYIKGVVSFYDAISKLHLYSFICHPFTETLYPYFCPYNCTNEMNSAPLIITPSPDAGLPKFNKPEVGLPKFTEPEVGLPKFNEPEVGLPKFTEPEVGLPKFNELEVGLPKFHEPEVGLPKFTKPEVGLPKFSEPKAGLPSFTLPKDRLPNFTILEDGLSKLTVPEAGPPKFTLPKAEHPKFTLPKAGNPKFTSPKAEHPKFTLPKAEHPKVTSKKARSQKIIGPKVGLPIFEVPEAGLPELSVHEPRFPKFTSPKVGLPKSIQPEAGLPRYTIH